MPKKSVYAEAGVDVEENKIANEIVGRLVKQTRNENVEAGMEGLFSAGYRIDRSKGTFFTQKIIPVERVSGLEETVRFSLQRLTEDGYTPLFITDYLAFGELRFNKPAKIVLDLMQGARRSDGIFLPIIGGEIAEMPGVIKKNGVEIVLAVTCQSHKDIDGRSVNISTYQGDILTASIDSVGTKTKLGLQLGITDGLFEDMIGHSVGDISVQFAKPFGVAMYVGYSPFFILGETTAVHYRSVARTPGIADFGFVLHQKNIYCKEQFDIVGSILGIVDEKDLLTGQNIEEGDYLIGLKCFGVNTNGYSLIRRLGDKGKIDYYEEMSGTGMTVGKALMQPHENYGEEVWKAREFFGEELKGAAHITGSGIEENTKRLLPEGLRVHITDLPDNPVFEYLQRKGKIKEKDMTTTFNRGVGVVYVVGKDHDIRNIPDKYMVIGRVEKAT